MIQPILPSSPSVEQMNRAFDALRERSADQRKLNAKQRIKRLESLYAEIWRRRADLKKAMWDDFRKPAEEVDLTEIFVIKSEIKAVKKRLRRWMKPRRVAGGLALLGSASWIRQEAKGVALIIAPWNYPMQLVFRPLVADIAAGCTVMLKPSELTGQTAQVLELGGKSPAIVDESASMKATAKKIAWAKLSNAGQICVAPDYIFVPRRLGAEFVEALKAAMVELYPGIVAENPDYQRIVKDAHAQRLLDLLDDAVSKGAKVAHGGTSDATRCFVHPTILTEVPVEAKIMEEEVFGPILPVILYDDLQEVVESVNSRPVPLALYIYSKRNPFVSEVLDSVQSGGVSINNSVIHVSSNHLPFGGLGNSGIGSGHGEHGFKEFTHMRGVYEQRMDGAASLLMPPYAKWKTKWIDRLLRWL